jgi:hypothetical protein
MLHSGNLEAGPEALCTRGAKASRERDGEIWYIPAPVAILEGKET